MNNHSHLTAIRYQGFRLTARALVVVKNRLLLVSDDGDHWYTPGGRLEPDETLSDCIEREVYEETGLYVKTGALKYVLECFDIRDNIHKIHFFFQAKIVEGSLQDSWNDDHGTVQHRRYFTLEEIQTNHRIMPPFLALGEWLKMGAEDTASSPYKGCLLMRGGFELVE